jgi:hypothetical protein
MITLLAVPGENASVVHTTPGLGTDAVGVQARIAGVLDQELLQEPPALISELLEFES